MTTPTIFKNISIVASAVGGLWFSAPYLADIHDWHAHKHQIIKLVEESNRIKILEAKIQALEIKNHAYDITNDSLRMCIKVLSHGKNPKDSIFVQTYSGWKKFHRNTDWPWRRDPDR